MFGLLTHCLATHSRIHRKLLHRITANHIVFSKLENLPKGGTAGLTRDKYLVLNVKLSWQRLLSDSQVVGFRDSP
jgi:hypothetical protein